MPETQLELEITVGIFGSLIEIDYEAEFPEISALRLHAKNNNTPLASRTLMDDIDLEGMSFTLDFSASKLNIEILNTEITDTLIDTTTDLKLPLEINANFVAVFESELEHAKSVLFDKGAALLANEQQKYQDSLSDIEDKNEYGVDEDLAYWIAEEFTTITVELGQTLCKDSASCAELLETVWPIVQLYAERDNLVTLTTKLKDVAAAQELRNLRFQINQLQMHTKKDSTSQTI